MSMGTLVYEYQTGYRRITTPPYGANLGSLVRRVLPTGGKFFYWEQNLAVFYGVDFTTGYDAAMTGTTAEREAENAANCAACNTAIVPSDVLIF